MSNLTAALRRTHLLHKVSIILFLHGTAGTRTLTWVNTSMRTWAGERLGTETSAVSSGERGSLIDPFIRLIFTTRWGGRAPLRLLVTVVGVRFGTRLWCRFSVVFFFWRSVRKPAGQTVVRTPLRTCSTYFECVKVTIDIVLITSGKLGAKPPAATRNGGIIYCST